MHACTCLSLRHFLPQYLWVNVYHGCLTDLWYIFLETRMCKSLQVEKAFTDVRATDRVYQKLELFKLATVAMWSW